MNEFEALYCEYKYVNEKYCQAMEENIKLGRRIRELESQPMIKPHKREFQVNTPMGVLRVYAKHDTDSPEDYPGIYIDLIRPGTERDMSDAVCTVEYDSNEKRIQTVAFDAEMDAPVAVTVYAESEESNADNSCSD